MKDKLRFSEGSKDDVDEGSCYEWDDKLWYGIDEKFAYILLSIYYSFYQNSLQKLWKINKKIFNSSSDPMLSVHPCQNFSFCQIVPLHINPFITLENYRNLNEFS